MARRKQMAGLEQIGPSRSVARHTVDRSEMRLGEKAALDRYQDKHKSKFNGAEERRHRAKVAAVSLPKINF